MPQDSVWRRNPNVVIARNDLIPVPPLRERRGGLADCFQHQLTAEGLWEDVVYEGTERNSRIGDEFVRDFRIRCQFLSLEDKAPELG